MRQPQQSLAAKLGAKLVSQLFPDARTIQTGQAKVETVSVDSLNLPFPVVKSSARPYWQKNWHKKDDKYIGFYVTRYARFRGEIVKKFTGAHKFYVIDPPASFSKHPNRGCFSRKGKGRWAIHFHKRPELSAGILQIEKILGECS